MYYYINSFYLYSLFGYFYEMIVGFILYKKYLNNLLIEPIKPIYGIGILIIIIIEKIIYNKTKLTKKKKLIIFIITIIVTLTLLECLSGYFLHLVFHKDFWSYKNYPLHLGKYICLPVSLLWGLFSLIYISKLKQKTDKIIKKIPEWFSNYLIIITITDILLSIII